MTTGRTIALDRQRIVLGLALVATSVFLGLSIAEGRYTVVGLLVAALVGVVLSARPVRLVVAIISAAVINQSVTYWLGLPPALSYVVDALVILLFVMVVLRSVLAGRLIVHWWVLPFPLALLASSAVSSINAQLGQALAGYVIPLMLFVAVANMEDLSQDDESIILKTLIFLVAIQVPITAVQWLIHTSGDADRIGGTFGRSGTTFMGVFVAGAWCFLMASMVHQPRRRTLLLMALALAPLLFGEVKAGFVLAVFGAISVAMFFTLFSAKRHRAPIAAALATVPAAILLLVYRYAPWLISNSAGGARSSLQLVTSPDAAIAYASGFSRTGQANRFEVLRVILRENASRGTQLLGNGPGLLSREASHVGPVSGDWLTGILAWATSGGRFLMELGVVGMLGQLIFVGGIGSLGFGVFSKSEAYQDRVLGMGLMGASLTFALGGFYTSAWQFDGIVIPFCVLGGLAALHLARIKEGTV